MYYLSAVCIVRDETEYLDEYLCFHLAAGIEHFYIYDNESKIKVSDTLKNYIQAGLVDVIDFPGVAKQMPAYDHFLKHFGEQTKWALIADADEFLIPISKNTIPEILTNYEDYNLSVSWRIFGSSGHIEKPKGLIIENYIKAISRDHWENTHLKALIQPSKTLKAFSNPHHMIPKKEYKTIHSDTYQEIRSAWSKHSCNHLQLNHYLTKSLEDFKEKISKPRADTDKYPPKTIVDFVKFDDLAAEEDLSALKLLDKTKELMEKYCEK